MSTQMKFKVMKAPGGISYALIHGNPAEGLSKNLLNRHYRFYQNDLRGFATYQPINRIVRKNGGVVYKSLDNGFHYYTYRFPQEDQALATMHEIEALQTLKTLLK